jgi:tetratricopeptide (TPR) repeat protein
MNFNKTLFIVILALIFSSVASADDYFNRITMASDGRIARFAHYPVTVNIPPPNIPDNLKKFYVEDVEYALDQWSGISEGLLTFKRIDSEDADIRICWTDKMLSGEADPLGEANLVQFDSGGFYVNISILVRGIPSSVKSLHKEMRSVLLHEIGHAIGLWGHSNDPNDVMYFRTKADYPTRRDKETLLKLLSYAPGSPLHEIAITELKSDISTTPKASHLHFWLGSVYADKGNDELAIDELTYALRLDPTLLKAADRLARVFQKEGMYDKAIMYYSKAAGKEQSPVLFGMIGMLHFQQKKYDKAILYFEKAYEMDNKISAAKNNALAAYHLWATDLIKNGQAESAISILSKALTMFPSSRMIYYDLGTAYDTSKQYEKAIEYYKKVLEIEPSFSAAKRDIATCMNNLGAEKIKNGNLQESISFCSQALDWDSDCWQAKKNLEMANLGLARIKQGAGNLDDAQEYYNAVLQINPSNLDSYVGLGDVFYEKGIYKDAIEYYQSALNIDPNLQYAKDGIAFIKHQINISRAKLIALITILSLLLCFTGIILYRLIRNRKRVTRSKQLRRRYYGKNNV